MVPAFTEAQAAAIAADFQVTDGPNDQGQMFQRPGTDCRLLPAALRERPGGPRRAGRQAAAGYVGAGQGARLRSGFPAFIFDAFTHVSGGRPRLYPRHPTGYADPPAGFTLPPGGQYNKYFPGHAIGMPKPLSDGQVEYTDGTPMTVDQYGRDVSAFLMWAAEPTLNARHRLGFQVMIFLIVFSALLYFSKKKVWHDLLHDPGLEKPRAPSEYLH